MERKRKRKAYKAKWIADKRAKTLPYSMLDESFEEQVSISGYFCNKA